MNSFDMTLSMFLKKGFEFELIADSNNLSGLHGRLYHFLDLLGKEYRVYSFPIIGEAENCPNENSIARKEFFLALKGNLIFSVHKGDSIIFAVSSEKVEFFGWFKTLGIKLLMGLKTPKRASQLLKPYLGFAKIGVTVLNPDSVKILEKETADGKKLSAKGMIKYEKVMDGAIAISRRLYLEIIRQTAARLEKIGMDTEEKAGVMRLLTSTLVFNGRLFIPRIGFIKGQFFVCDMKEDVVTHKTNIKKELGIDGDYAYVGIDPQPGKLKGYTNRQAVRNFPEAFGCGFNIKVEDSSVYHWVVNTLDTKIAAMDTNELEDSLDELRLDLIHGRIEESHTTQQRMWLCMWKEWGDIRSLPAVLKGVWRSGMQRVADLYELSIRVQIPGAVYCQLVSESVLRMLGIDYTVPKGAVMYCKEYMLFVTSDDEYFENLRNHGGMDADDKLSVIFRKRGDEIVCFMHRNPSDRGEYNVCTFIGTPPIEVPDIQLPAKMPLKATERDAILLARGEKLPELPSKSRTKKDYKGEYTFENFLCEVEMEGLNPGTIINVITLWNLAHPNGERNNIMVPMEDVVDTCQQTRDPEDIEWIKMTAARMIGDLVLRSDKCIDELVLEKCKSFFEKTEYPNIVADLKAKNRLGLSWFSRLVKASAEKVKVALGKVDSKIELVRIRNHYLALLTGARLHANDKVNKDALEMLKDRYRTMCNLTAKDAVPAHLRKFSRGKWVLKPAAYEWMDSEIQKHMRCICKKFAEWGIKHEFHTMFVGLAHVAHLKKVEKTDHLLCRRNTFPFYFKLFKKFQMNSFDPCI